MPTTNINWTFVAEGNVKVQLFLHSCNNQNQPVCLKPHVCFYAAVLSRQFLKTTKVTGLHRSAHVSQLLLTRFSFSPTFHLHGGFMGCFNRHKIHCHAVKARKSCLVYFGKMWCDLWLLLHLLSIGNKCVFRLCAETIQRLPTVRCDISRQAGVLIISLYVHRPELSLLVFVQKLKPLVQTDEVSGRDWNTEQLIMLINSSSIMSITLIISAAHEPCHEFPVKLLVRRCFQLPGV